VNEWQALQEAVAGEVILPGDERYEEARKPEITRFHGVMPQAIVRCATPADVAAVLAHARRTNTPVTPRSGGHCFAGRSTTTGIVIDTRPMRAISVDGDTTTVGAGARLGEIYDVLDEHGVTIAGGCGPPVGIVGLTLGGGLGIMGRKHGLTCDQLLAAQVVLPSGEIVDCSEGDELFWALRGAGALGLGVVTSLTFRTVPAPDATAFHLTFAQSTAAIAAWQRWAPAAPDELAASLLVNRTGVHVFGAMLAGEADTSAQLDRLSATPESAHTVSGPYREIKRHLAENGPGEEAEGDLYMRSEFFRRPLPPDAIAQLMRTFQTSDAPRELDFTPWGGAYNRVPETATAFPHRSELFLLKHAAMDDADWVTRSFATTHAYGTGGTYPNFPEPGLDDRAYYGTNLERAMTFSRSLRHTSANDDGGPHERTE
jgi:FAD/FMN-containing dehydrogenase